MNRAVTVDAISEAICTLRDRYIADGEAVSYEAINAGLCSDFAITLIEQFGSLQDCEISDVEVASFLQVDEEEDDPYEPGRPFDRKLLREHWPQVKPPAGLTWKELNEVSESAAFDTGTHTWLTYDGWHFDAECPEGVRNFFELPFFKRVIEHHMTDRELCAARP